MSRALRYLRIAFSVTCGIACVLLVVLWVRSYSWVDFFGNIGAETSFAFQQGHMLIHPHIQYHPDGLPILTKGIRGNVAAGVAAIPIWFLFIVIATLAALPWIRWRFSLRTLLIATTLVALSLGAIIALSR